MSLVDRTRASAEALLEPGETMQAAFGGQTWAPTLLGGLAVSLGLDVAVLTLLIRRPLRVVVVTNKRILACRAGPLKRSTIHSVLEEIPRNRPMSQPEGKWWICSSLGERMWVHRRFFDQVRIAERLRPVR
jgi:hypothetical protein